VKLLLDTHTFLWWDSEPELLSPTVLQLCRAPENTLVLSVVSAWEIQVKSRDREYFVPFADYPAFRQATVEQIVNLHQPAPDQLCWPDLDIDIELPALDEPERFPLAYVPS
jgi:hypothetical protein